MSRKLRHLLALPHRHIRAVDGGFQSTAKRPTSNPPLMPDAPQCHYCNDTGMVACRSRDGQYAFAGPVPDDAKGYFDADCWYCDSGRPPVQAHRN